MPYRLKIASRDHANQVADHVIKLLAELDSQPISNFDFEEYTQVAEELIKSDKITAILAYKDDDHVGLLTLNPCYAVYNKGEFGEICELYVEPECRSDNVGKLLVDEALKVAQERGWGTVEVGAPSYEEWGRTISFYKKNGFKEIGPRLYIELE